MATGYRHNYRDFGDRVMRSPELAAHLDAIVQRAGLIAQQTAPVSTGQFKDSFVVGTEIADRSGSRVIGFLASTDPKAEAKEFANPDPAENRTMNKAVRKALG